jgi:hypothetical protein
MTPSFRTLLLSTFTFALPALGQAANIIWSSPQGIVGDGDVSTLGTFVDAVSIGNDSAVTVNGVTFGAFNPAAVPTGTFAITGAAGYAGYGVDLAPFNTLSAVYQNLLTHGDFGSGNSVMTLTIGGLTIGRAYLFQWWANDSRNSYNPQTVSATAGTVVTLNADTTAAPGGIGQYAIGTFVADAATQTVDFQGGVNGGTLENAFQLRDITNAPEPCAGLLLGLGAPLCFGLVRRRSAGSSSSNSTR